MIDQKKAEKSASFALNSYRTMWEIRLFEEAVQDLFDDGKMYGTMHLCIGQEATAAGGAGVLNKTDWVLSTHRNHGHAIAKGTDRRAMLAEILGKQTGTNRGKGGSMHIADLTVGNLGSNGIVGGNFPIAAGAALTAKMNQTEQVVLCYGGDGATNEGSFHEALNLASIWALPVVYLIENNQYGMSSAIQQMVNVKKLSDRAESYGIEGLTIDGNDVFAVQRAVEISVEKARKGGGPTLIEAITYRYKGHSKSDKLVYRSKEECQYWMENHDPILKLEQRLAEEFSISNAQLAEIRTAVQQETEEMVRSVLNDPEPELKELWQDVYQEGVKQ
ncbi:thiamine pyrophosphate-dependent dehydrogenase E1 component subunit alpha [Enterococcus sp. BWB1-3]|uniref:thiamine pyrophosphate-dependent dehydrogenase E1 component subunit alpha n=1 Tax=Enterococcus sp. BWB1-3 TaxID=2787713 RepID=UPI00192346F6|nr:thiamine pyrophosphate-dependent dehydrogenase E1 component subunit alpha [Enterococcus sp. BWB1-3]MBL1230579.1 thiamine pyrophosphate-dependent dehydrogenase E1 component subunit alpha [Enterococcus sp. BWB1-3]